MKPGGRCPTLVATHSHGSPAGLSDDGSLLYTVFTSGIEVRDFPSLAFNSDIDLDPAMDALGAGGGGSIQVAAIDDTGYLYAAAYVTSGTSIQLFKVLLDGTSPTLLWTAGEATSLADTQAIGWHPAEPDYIWLLYGTDAGDSKLVGIHRSTGALHGSSGTFVGEPYLANMNNLQQYDDGFVFFTGISGAPNTGTIRAWTVAVTGNDEIAAADSFGGMGTRPDGYTIWGEGPAGAGGDQGMHAFTIASGPTIVETSDVCDDAWGIGPFYDPPIYWFANPNRTLVFVSSGVNVWQWT